MYREMVTWYAHEPRTCRFLEKCTRPRAALCLLVRCCTVTCCRCVANPRREETRAAACCSFVRLGCCRGLLLRVCLCGAVGVVTRVKTACCSAGLGLVGCVRCSAWLVLVGAFSQAVTFLRLASAARTRDPAVFFLRCVLCARVWRWPGCFCLRTWQQQYLLCAVGLCDYPPLTSAYMCQPAAQLGCCMGGLASLLLSR